MDMPSLHNTGPAGIIPAISQAYDFGEKVASAGERAEATALTLDVARRAKAEYEDSIKPVYKRDLLKTIPPDQAPAILQMLDLTSTPKGDGEDVYYQKKDVKSFFDNFKKNPIAQALVIKSSKEFLDEAEKPLNEKIKFHMEKPGGVAERQAYFKQQMALLEKATIDEKTGQKKTVNGVPMMVDLNKRKALEDEVQQYTATDPDFKAMTEAQKQKQILRIEKNKRDHAMGLLDDTHKKMVEKIGLPATLAVEAGETTYEAEYRKIRKADKEDEMEARKNMLLELEALRQPGRMELQREKNKKPLAGTGANTKAKETFTDPLGNTIVLGTDMKFRDANGNVLKNVDTTKLKRIGPLKEGLLLPPPQIKKEGKEPFWAKYNK